MLYLTGGNIMLVILHYKNRYQLERNRLSDDDDLLEDEYHLELLREKRIAHFAFHERDGGLYDHPQNKEGMKRLVEFVFTQKS
jgi:hypothetical protein